MRANPASVPSGLRASASTTQASLPESTMIPRIRSSTLTRSRVSRNMVEPPKLAACSETGSTSSIASVPRWMASKVMKSVMSFDIDAGGRGLSAFFESMTAPVRWSITYAAPARVSKDWAWAAPVRSVRISVRRASIFEPPSRAARPALIRDEVRVTETKGLHGFQDLSAVGL